MYMLMERDGHAFLSVSFKVTGLIYVHVDGKRDMHS